MLASRVLNLFYFMAAATALNIPKSELPNSGAPANLLPRAAIPPRTPCTSEGLFNCIDGTKFQRCAGGVWSAILSMPAGTRC
jgi:hypothetical protein